MGGMVPAMRVKQKTPPPVGEDAAPTKRVANNAAVPSLPDRDGPSKRSNPTPSKKTTEPAKKKGADIKGMRKSIAKMGMF